MIPAFKRIIAGRSLPLSASGGSVMIPTKDLVFPKSNASSLMSTPQQATRLQTAGAGEGRVLCMSPLSRFEGSQGVDTPNGRQDFSDAPSIVLHKPPHGLR